MIFMMNNTLVKRINRTNLLKKRIAKRLEYHYFLNYKKVKNKGFFKELYYKGTKSLFINVIHKKYNNLSNNCNNNFKKYYTNGIIRVVYNEISYKNRVKYDNNIKKFLKREIIQYKHSLIHNMKYNKKETFLYNNMQYTGKINKLYNVKVKNYTEKTDNFNVEYRVLHTKNSQDNHIEKSLAIKDFKDSYDDEFLSLNSLRDNLLNEMKISSIGAY